MKTVIKLLIAAVIVNAAYRCGSVALRYYQFKDQVQQMVLFGQNESAGELTNQILAEAIRRDVPLESDGLAVNREGARSVADVSYTESVEVFPRFFYPVTFTFSAEAFGLAGAPSGARQ